MEGESEDAAAGLAVDSPRRGSPPTAGQAYRGASRRTRRLFKQTVFDCIEVCDRKLASVRYQALFNLLLGTSKFEYEAVVAHTLSYSNPDELRIRVARLAKAAGWTA